MTTGPIRPMPIRADADTHTHTVPGTAAAQGTRQSLPLPPQILPRKRGSRTSRKPHLLSPPHKKSRCPQAPAFISSTGVQFVPLLTFYINYRFRYPLLAMIAHPLPAANNPLLWREKSPSVQAVTPVSDERLWQHYRLSSQPSHSD